MYKKGLAIVIIVLFIGVSFQPIIAEKTESVEKTSDHNNIDFEQAKHYLFQTLIDISNNPEVKVLLKQSNQRIFTSDYDYKDVFLQLLFKKPRLLRSILFTRPKMTSGYLDKSYNNGIELIDILGKEESLDIVESVKIINPALFNELKNIITNDEELSNKIIALGEMNEELEPIPPYLRPICWILFIIILPYVVFHEIWMFIQFGYLNIPEHLEELIGFLTDIFRLTAILPILLGVYFSCW